MYLVKSPFWLPWLYPALIWHKSRSDKYIYLTFDDGPIPVVTPFVLETLKTFRAKGTFFCIGDNVRKHPDIFERVVNEGHRIGNHTFNHLKGWGTDDKIYLDNVQQCAELVHSNIINQAIYDLRAAEKPKNLNTQYSIRNTQSSCGMY